jgi:hypothetical protein
MSQSLTIENDLIVGLNELFQRYRFNFSGPPPKIIVSTEEINPEQANRSHFRQTQMHGNDNHDFIEVDGFLGLYEPEHNKINIYVDSIGYCSNTYFYVDFWSLCLVVLVHEYSHWIVHKLIDSEGHIWKKGKCMSAFEEVHLTFTQLFTYWAIMNDDRLDQAMDDLLDNQSEAYSLYRDFSDVNKVLMIESLLYLRTIDDAKLGNLEAFWDNQFSCDPLLLSGTRPAFRKYFPTLMPKFESFLSLMELDDILFN